MLIEFTVSCNGHNFLKMYDAQYVTWEENLMYDNYLL